ncbi:hypothetical protein [Sporosarcina gallistercoris]|uniref:Uncharacterized protein n=1 Tax=Sporosarcina gallistercoris TaxID=2762245 RepID=A0ABR8PJF4_9BACL|nr:hypothetical protein [Sporosarcina gallistercoris]MBD7908286.1 hypothetical protein [Sporosarcina gallistercoris]
MDHANSSKENEEPTPISASLRLALISSILITIADGIATISVIAAIDEELSNGESEKQDQKELDDKFENMQKQIDKLTYELAKVRSARF